MTNEGSSRWMNGNKKGWPRAEEFRLRRREKTVCFDEFLMMDGIT